MQAGKLDRRIAIQEATTSTDGDNQTVETWTEWASSWAQFIPQAGTEELEGESVVPVQTARFVIRWRSGVTTAMRVIHDGETYYIRSVMEIGRRVGLDITAEVRRDGG